MRILYNSTNHDVVCTDQAVEYTDHGVAYIFHGDNLEIDEIVIIFDIVRRMFLLEDTNNWDHTEILRGNRYDPSFRSKGWTQKKGNS